MTEQVEPRRLFVVAGEHSGDALGAKLMSGLKALHAGPITFAGVGGEHMEAEGLTSLFPLADVAVMGPLAILRRLAPLISRVYQTVDAGLAMSPDAVVIIDSPEFTHPIVRCAPITQTAQASAGRCSQVMRGFDQASRPPKIANRMKARCRSSTASAANRASTGYFPRQKVEKIGRADHRPCNGR